MYIPGALNSIYILKPTPKGIKLPKKVSKVFIFSPLCKGKLAKPWGLGGLFKHHSRLVYNFVPKVCKVFFFLPEILFFSYDNFKNNKS